MNLYEKFVKETNKQDEYVSWLESKVTGKQEPVETNPIITSARMYIAQGVGTNSLFPKPLTIYNDTNLHYQTQIIFPRLLGYDEKDTVEEIVNYWSHIPYVTEEGNYGMEWDDIMDCSVVTIEIDFTKSASDDYVSRKILHKLADWIENGTPVRRNGSQKHSGVIEPLVVRADCP